MPVFQHLLQRWGFVKLRRYGLELTPDGRILSNRRVVLDDGTGGRIVGWRDADVAISQLSAWSDSETPRAAVAAPVAVPRPAAPPARPVMTRPSAILPEPLIASANVMQVDVAAEPTVDEDDWAWTIALARARTATEDAEVARPSITSRTSGAGSRPRERLTPPVTASPIAAPIAASIAAPVKDPAASGEWPKTAPIGAIDYDDHSQVSTRPAVAIPRSAPAPVARPRTMTNTVIPVPALPTMAATGRRLEPVRTTQVPPASATRFAKGTGPVDPPTTSRRAAVIVEDTIPNLSVGDRTRPGIAMPPATARPVEPAGPPVDDRTKPGIALPPAARAVELPSIKRRMSPR